MADHLPPAGGALRLDHVGVTVVDLEAAAQWWCAAFGLRREVQLRIEPIDLELIMLIDDVRGHRIELLHRRGLRAMTRPADPAAAALVPGYSHVAFDVRDLDVEHHRLVRLGAREVMRPQPSPEPGVRMSYLADPESNLIELVERTAR